MSEHCVKHPEQELNTDGLCLLCVEEEKKKDPKMKLGSTAVRGHSFKVKIGGGP